MDDEELSDAYRRNGIQGDGVLGCFDSDDADGAKTALIGPFLSNWLECPLELCMLGNSEWIGCMRKLVDEKVTPEALEGYCEYLDEDGEVIPSEVAHDYAGWAAMIRAWIGAVLDAVGHCPTVHAE